VCHYNPYYTPGPWVKWISAKWIFTYVKSFN
jgi:hypothetical protein